MGALCTQYTYVVESNDAQIARGVSDVLSVQILPECQIQPQDKDRRGRRYTLEELQSLESRLVLIGGNYGEKQQDIASFVDVRVDLFWYC